MAFSCNLIMWLRPLLVILCLVAMICAPVNGKVGKVCKEIDARNDPSSLEALRGCNIVLGSVSIVLIERFNASYDINKVSFPELREITGYLLFFRVFKLESLRTLFPNLSVIRGEKLILHYALIIHEMPDLREIGLISLIKILRGLVMIRLCPMLCYVNTIDWNSITQPHMFNGLGNYLGFDSNDACPTSKSCPDTCPNYHCWNNQNCQLFDKNEVKINDRLTITCHDECLGGCEDSSPNTCKVCRNFRIQDGGACVNKCPPDLFVYNSLCVSASFCIKRRKQPLLGECRQYCDSMINGNITNPSQCIRTCGAVEVDSLSASDLVRGCQIIQGDLFIRIQSGVVNTMQYLERNLGDIEEIEGVLKVYRSPVITSLSFLRNLRIIRGQTFDKVKYTINIMSNENLQELWDFNEKKSLKLEKGNLLIHFNSKLCLSQIRELQKILKTNTSEDFVSVDSNGYEQTCSARAIATWNKVLDSGSVEISWEKINITDAEKIMGYIIFYVVAPERNITHRGIDTCVQYGWQTHFIQNVTTNETTSFHTTIISNLTQNTQYAYYVKTQVVPTINEEMLNFTGQGQSNIEYFTTEADVPAPPQVRTLSKTHNSLTLIWHPLRENELIEYYRVDYFIQPDEHDFLDSRDYCLNPRVEINVGIETNDPSSNMQKSCTAEYENWRLRNPNVEDPEYAWRMYRKAQCAAQAHKRSVNGDIPLQMMKYIENHQSCGAGQKCVTDRTDFETLRFSRQIHEFLSPRGNNNIEEPDFGPNYIARKEFPNSQLNTTINELLPYTMYVFQFFACLRPNNCSSYFLYFDRTEPFTTADNIDLNVVIDPYDSNRVHLDFAEPKHPNGLTVAFQIEKHDLSNFQGKTYCITRKQHYDNGKRYTFEHLNKGRYVFRVRSISLAQTGAYTDDKFIVVYDPSNSTLGIILIIFLIVLLASACVTVGIYVYRRMKHRLRIRSLNASTQNIMLHTDEGSSGIHQDEEVPPFYHTQSDRVFF